jgi:hypothetical protein
MRITPGRLLQRFRQDPATYEDELRTLLGFSVNERGYRCIKDPILRPRNVSILDVGEAFVGRDGLRHIYEHPYGLRGGHALTQPPADWAFEEVGGGALGPSQFAGLNGWLATVDGLLGAELLEQYVPAVQVARELVDWRLDVRVQENKLIRYTAPTEPTEDLLPSQEFPAGDLGSDWVRANRMRKQGMALDIAWEAAHFDQTDSLLDAAEGIADRLALIVNRRVEMAVWGCENTHNRQGTITNTYRTSGSYINMIANEFTGTTAALDVAEQQLKQQKDPVTGLPIGVPAGPRDLIVTPAKALSAFYTANPVGTLSLGSFTDPEQRQVNNFYTAIRVPEASQFAVDLMVKYLALTATQAGNRWIWGNTKKAFQYRSAKDITTYRFTIADTPTLARRDVLMELDCSEMGSVTTLEPRFVILNHKDV